MKNLTKTWVLSGFMFLGAGLAQATPIPPNIFSTVTITTDSQLTSDVSCEQSLFTCIKFGAPGIKLKLNGFTMRGSAGTFSGCFDPEKTAIDTNLQNNASIQGPGLVKQFDGFGIVVSGNHSRVRGVAVFNISLDGIRVLGSGNLVEANSVSRASLAILPGFPDAFFAGIAVIGTGGHTIRHNEVGGQGFEFCDPPPASSTTHAGTESLWGQIIISLRRTTLPGIPERE